MAIDLGNTPTGTPPSPAEKLQIRSAIGVGTTDAPTFLAQTLTGQSLTGTQATSLVDLSATWNTSGTPSAIKLNVTETGAGSNAASNLMDLQVGGVSKLKVTKTGDTSLFFLRASSSIYAGVGVFAESYFTLGGYSQSTRLYQDDAGILAQRNGTNAQTFRVYNTYTDAINYSRLKIGYEVANYAAFVIAGEQLGSGGGRNLALSGGGNVFGIGTAANGNFNWVINGGHLLAGTDNLHDIGAIGANRPKNIYAGSSLFTGSGIGVGIYHPTFGGLAFQSSGVVTIYGGSSYTTFDKFQIGGNTSAFPTLKRVGTELQVVIASTTASINVAAVDADMTFIEDRYRRKGAGSPETAVTAPIGAVYHRTDGGASTTLYVKESSPTPSTGWVAK